jgi:hypothetical protein
MTNNKDNIAKCSRRFRSVTDKFTRETERIDTLDTEELKQRLELTTDIHDMWKDFSADQLRHLNIILLLQSTNHDMSIAMCKCAKDLEISIPENIESPNQFHKHILE